MLDWADAAEEIVTHRIQDPISCSVCNEVSTKDSDEGGFGVSEGGVPRNSEISR